MDLTKYLAKDKKSIAQHINDLQHCLEVLVNIGYVKTEHLRKLIYIACKYHDYGKVNPEFQKRVSSIKWIKFNKDIEISHNVLSVFFINKDNFDDYNDYLKVFFAVAYHHNYCDVSEVFREKRDLIDKLLENFETYKIKKSVFNNTAKIMEDIESILVKGFLHKCDYCASAECEVEFKNDFLNNSLANLVNKWRVNNPNADWKEMQIYCYENSNENIIVVAQTGMGKTEGGLRWIGNNKGFFVLPLKTAINAMYDRIKEDILNNDVKEKLSILHSESLNYVVKKHPEIDDPKEYNDRGKKLSMPLTVTTMDQLFDFVFKYNGYEMKLTTFSYSKIVIDEIQMYGPELLAYLIRGIEMITEMGGKVAIITATLPPFIKDMLGNKFKYKEFIDDSVKRHNVKVINNEISAEDIIAKHCANINDNKPNKILVICNTIRKAQAMYDEIVKEVDEGNVNIFHTRFTKKDRAEKETHILNTGKNEGGENEIWITTSVVEASLDIDFDYLFTELQDLNSLFQRMGRCNRKGEKPIDETNCFVYTKIDSNLISNGSRGFIDRTMYNLSKEAISEIDGVISESDKLNLINTYFTTEKVRNSEFFKKYHDIYNNMKKIEPYALDISEIEVRHIMSVDIIPKSLYDKNEERYEFIKKQLEVEKDTVKKIKLLEELSENVVSIPYYDYDRTKKCKDIEIKGRKYYCVLDCKYDSKIGFKADRNKQNYATFW
ncbi:MAG: CRISPR-associated helicase Cas3' [Lachnospirales bacterium]